MPFKWKTQTLCHHICIEKPKQQNLIKHWYSNITMALVVILHYDILLTTATTFFPTSFVGVLYINNNTVITIGAMLLREVTQQNLN